MKKIFAAGIFTLSFLSVGPVLANDFSEEGIDSAEVMDLNSTSGELYPEDIRVRKVYQCRARNARGQNFTARAPSRGIAQRRAINHCYNYSARCRLVGCTVKWQVGYVDGDSRWDRR